MRNRQAERSKRALFLRIFGALAIIILVWVIFFLPKSQDETQLRNPADTLAHKDAETIPAEVSDFVTFVKLSRDTVTSDEASIYSSMGIEQLSITLESFIDRNAENYHSLTSKTDELKSLSADLEKGSANNNTDKARKAFLIAADVLESIFGKQKVIDVKTKAEAIDENVVLEKQLDQVKDYFVSASDVFREISGIEDKNM